MVAPADLTAGRGRVGCGGPFVRAGTMAAAVLVGTFLANAVNGDSSVLTMQVRGGGGSQKEFDSSRYQNRGRVRGPVSASAFVPSNASPLHNDASTGVGRKTSSQDARAYRSTWQKKVSEPAQSWSDASNVRAAAGINREWVQGETNGNENARSGENTNATPQTVAAVSSAGAIPSPIKPQNAHSLGFEAILFMSLLALQFGIQPILVKRFTPQSICRSSVVLVQELVKFVIAAAVFFSGSQKEHRAKELSNWNVKTWLTIAGVPAALYTVQNMASLLAYQNLEAMTFNVLNQTKVLSAALSCYFVMGKKQSRMQIVSLCILLASALVIERVVTLQAFASPLLSGGSGLIAAAKSAFGSLGSMQLAKRLTHGVFPILLASLISGLAGALTQKNLQGASRSGEKKSPRNAYLFSMEMNVASVIILLASLLFSADGRRIAQNGFFHHWTPQTLIPVFTNAAGGIIVGLVTKYAGSVRKGFALIFGILLSGALQAGSTGLAAEQIIGGLLAGCALWMHMSHPYQAKSKAIIQ